MIQGLVAAGEDPSAPAWTKGGHTALTNLRTFQDAANGGFTFPGNPGPDAFTTSQVPAGLAQVPFPGRTTWTTGATLPSGVCAAVAPSPSGSARPIATPPATATGARPGPAPADSGWLPLLALLGLAGVTVTARARSRRLPR